MEDNKNKIFYHNDIWLITGLTFIAILAWYIVFMFKFNSLFFPDSLLYGSIARDIVDNTDIMYEHTKVELPLYTLFLSGLFNIFGVSDEVVALSTGIAFIFTVPFLYLLAKNLFGTKVAIVSSLIYIFDSALIFDYSISGLTEPLFMFFLVLFFYSLHRSESYMHYMITGAFMGLACLTRYDPIFYLLPVVGYILISCKENKVKNVAGFIFGFILIITPYFVYNYLQFGNPFINYILKGTEFLPLETLYTSSDQLSNGDLTSTLSTLGVEFSMIIKKIYISLIGYYNRLFKIFNIVVLAFFIVGIFRPFQNRKIKHLHLLFLIIFGIQLVIASGAAPYPKSIAQFRHIYLFYPLMVVFASDMIVYSFKTSDKERKQKYLLVALLFILFSYPTLSNFKHAFRSNLKSSPNIFYNKNMAAFVMRNTKADEIIITNRPLIMSWYAKRKYVGLPIEINSLLKKEDWNSLKTMVITFSFKDDIKYFGTYNPVLLKDWGDFLNGFPDKFLDFKLKEKMEEDGKVIAALYKKQQ